MTRRAKRKRGPGRQQMPGLGPWINATLLSLIALLFWLCWLLVGPVRHSVPVVRDLWAQPGAAGFSLFAQFAFIGILLLHLVVYDVLLPLGARQRPGRPRWAGTVMALALLGAIGTVLIRMAAFPLNDAWFEWAQVDEPAVTQWSWIGRIERVRDSEEPGDRALVLDVAMETGESIRVEVREGDGSYWVARLGNLFGSMPGDAWVRERSRYAADVPLEDLEEGAMVWIEEGSTLYSRKTLWRVGGVLAEDDNRMFARIYCSGRPPECLEALHGPRI